MSLYCFEPGYFERIWGGTRLRGSLGLPTPEGKTIGEAWMVSDHATFESRIVNGPCAGETLHDLMRTDAVALLGRIPRPTPAGRFPLLLKLLDSGDALSVQVHPDDECAARLGEPDVGKTEMWHVLEADPESRLICGLDPAVDADTFVASVKSDAVAELMNSFGVDEGTTVFVPAGVVHAIGGGILLAEIQQNSDLTYRIYDWGRVESDGKPRTLHLDKAREAIKFGLPFGGAATPVSAEEDGVRRDLLSQCPHFTAERLTFSGSIERVNDGASFHIILAVAGGVSVRELDEEVALKRGECVLVSGDSRAFSIIGSGSVLDYHL